MLICYVYEPKSTHIVGGSGVLQLLQQTLINSVQSFVSCIKNDSHNDCRYHACPPCLSYGLDNSEQYADKIDK